MHTSLRSHRPGHLGPPRVLGNLGLFDRDGRPENRQDGQAHGQDGYRQNGRCHGQDGLRQDGDEKAVTFTGFGPNYNPGGGRPLLRPAPARAVQGKASSCRISSGNIHWQHGPFIWANVPILAVMIWSGLLIYWANDVYEIRLGGVTLVTFFPDWFYRALHVDHRLAEGMAWHFTFMWFFAINGLLYVAYTFWSGEWRDLVPNRHTFARGVAGRAPRPGHAQAAAAAAQVQRRPAAGLYRGGRDGGRLAA